MVAMRRTDNTYEDEVARVITLGGKQVENKITVNLTITLKSGDEVLKTYKETYTIPWLI